MRGLSVEVGVGTANGLDHAGVVNCDELLTIPVGNVGRLLGYLLDEQEDHLAEAIIAAFDLDL